MYNKMQVIKDNRTLMAMQCREKYVVNKKGTKMFEVFTNDCKFQAHVFYLGINYSAKDDNYNKQEYEKLVKFCELLQKLFCRP